MTGTKLAAFKKNVPPTPMAAIVRPPMAGPTMRAPLKRMLFSGTAFRSRSLPTISGTNACRVGLSKALLTPSASAST